MIGTRQRFREHEVAAAETAADFAVVLKIGAQNGEPDQVDSRDQSSFWPSLKTIYWLVALALLVLAWLCPCAHAQWG